MGNSRSTRSNSNTVSGTPGEEGERMRRITVTSLIAIAMLRLSFALAQNPNDPKDPNAPADNEPIVTKMRVQDYKAVQYFYVEHETTLNQIGDVIRQTLPSLFQTIGEHRVAVNGPMIFVYQ